MTRRARWIIGDHVRMMLFSVPANITQGLPDGSHSSASMPLPGSRDAVALGIAVEAFPAWPSHVLTVPATDGTGASLTLLVDVAKGTVKSSDKWLNAWSEPSASPAATSHSAAPASLSLAAAALAALAAAALR
jgi:hypothetical protein